MRNLISWQIVSPLIAWSVLGCGILWKSTREKELAESEICAALEVASTDEFRENGNQAHYDQLRSEESTFISVSDAVEEAFDGQNVIELKSAHVEFDFEDEEVDAGDLGGFWARWKILLVPYDPEIVQEAGKLSTKLDSLFHAQAFIDRLSDHRQKVEAQLSGPFAKNGCEWGDTDLIGAQTLTYSNYAVYDWDFFSSVDRVIGIIYEGDERRGDDLIAWLDFSKADRNVIVEKAGRYRIEFATLTNVATRLTSN